MKKNLPVAIAFALAAFPVFGQDPSAMTPNRDLGLVSKAVEIPAKYASLIPENFSVNIPAGFKAKFFFADAGLIKPRFMVWGPDSVLYVADNGRPAQGSPGKIIALPDSDHDGVADMMKVAAENVSAHSIAFYNGALYAAESGQVLKLMDADGDGVYESRETFISNIPTGGRHTTRTITFDAANRKMYLSIGSAFNARREDTRALIMEFNDDGTNGRIYATGIRNAVGMTMHPTTGRLWATNNGSDLQGNDVPPEWIDMVREGGFYGYPYAYHFKKFFNDYTVDDYATLLPLTAADTARLEAMSPAGALIQAHSAPMAMEFSNNNFHENYRNGAFVALRGAWNTSLPNGQQPGYKVIYMDFDNAQDTIANSVADFITGFQRSSGEWARPVGLAIDQRGNLYLGSDDSTKFIMVITPDIASGIEEEGLYEFGTDVSPNPVQDLLHISLKSPQNNKAVVVSFLNMLGENVLSKEITSLTTTVSLEELPVGAYVCKISDGKESDIHMIQVIR
jgi:glucose/arabinose dehydrogenase